MFKVVNTNRTFLMLFVSKLVILWGLFASPGNAAPLENHLQLSSEPEYDVGNPWIGSHILKFTPNPFLLNILNSNVLPQAKHLTQDDASDSNPTGIVSTGESPISLKSTTETPLDPFHNYVTQIKMGKRGRKIRRKVKGRRRLSPSNLNKARRNPASRYKTKGNIVDETKRRFISRKPKGKVFIFPTAERTNTAETEPIPSDFGKVDFLPIDRVSINPPEYIAKWRGLKSSSTKSAVGQSLLPKITTTTPAPETLTSPSPAMSEGVVVRITPPPPIKPNTVESKSNLIPVDIILNHGDKLDPSFFRNIILKTMMDKLAEVEVAKNGPQLASSSEKKSSN